jgi:tRNA threonylcarbamoyladenosine biosynthesis protein TsaB
MKILAFDSATSACSAAIWRDGEIPARRFQAMERGQSEALIPMVVEVLKEAGLTFAEIDFIAVTVGPGAFTGVRIGLAAARGMALAGGLPIIGVTTFEAMAHGQDADERAGRSLVVAIDAKRTDIYAQSFGPDLSPLGPAAAVMPEALASALPVGPLLIAGDGASLLRAALGAADMDRIRFAPGIGAPDAVHVAALAAERTATAAVDAAPRPLYLRPPDARLPENGRPRR